jgi:hypothetical protein
MNLKNKQTGRTVHVPEATEPDIFVGPLWIREGAASLTSEEIARDKEERRRKNLAQRELWSSRVYGLLWGVVGLVIWVGILCYFAQWFTEAMHGFLRNW